MQFSKEQIEVIKRCQQSCDFFLRHFGKIKHPSAGILPFKPFSYQRRALKCFREHRLNIFRKCFAEGSMIWTPYGSVPIENLKVGDKIYSYNEDHKSIEIDEVSDIWSTDKKETVEIVLTDYRRLCCTNDHLFHTSDGWVEARNLTQHHKLTATDSSLNIKNARLKGIFEGKERKVYDITVKKNSNFIVDGVVVHNCRQAGISKIAGGFATWFGMFHANKKILIVSRKNDDAMSFLRENIAFIYENLPLWMKEVWKPVKQNEHEILFPNNSHIQSLTSHPDVLRSHASSLNILDEVAFIPQMDSMWASGWPCVRGDTLIQTDEGLIEIEELANGGDPWKEINTNVASDSGYKHSNKAYVSGRKPTTIFNTYLGFEFEGADHHRVRIINGNGEYVWERLDNLKTGDIVVSVPGQFSGKRRTLGNGQELNEEIAEIIGLYVGGNHRECDDELFEAIGFNNVCPKTIRIPDIILKSDTSVLYAFLRGLFDSNGWIHKVETSLSLGFSTASKKLAEQVQICLHSIGIISRKQLCDNQFWSVHVVGTNSKQIFRDKIGFIDNIKQKLLMDDMSITEDVSMSIRCNISNELLANYLNKGYYFDTIVSINKGQADLYDISVPENNTYLANGIVSHNTLQHGGSVIAISTCVAPDTLVMTADGLKEIQNLAPEKYDGFDDGYYHVDYNGPDIVGINGLEKATKFYKRPTEPTKIVETSCSYKFEASLLHKLPVVSEDGSIINRYIKDLKVGDFLPVKAGQMVFGNNVNECLESQFDVIPEKLLNSSEPSIRSFLKKLFEESLLSGSAVFCTSTSYKFIKQVRMLLFNYGVKTHLVDAGYLYNLYVCANFNSFLYSILIEDHSIEQALCDNKVFMLSEPMPPISIGLIKDLYSSLDKNALPARKLHSLCVKNFVTKYDVQTVIKSQYFNETCQNNEAYKKLLNLLEYDWFNEVQSLDDSESEVYDFTLPKTHTFIGDCIVQANTNGVGGWYYNTMSEAESGRNNFNPIVVNWWDMDWAIEYEDSLTRKMKRICPIDGIRKCTNKEEIEKYGPYWSPWLEEQWQALQEQGETWKYDQEILARFVGSGNTILNKTVLAHLATTVQDPVMRIEGQQTYIHPVSGEVSELSFSFPTKEEGLWIWEKPVGSKPAKMQGNRIIEPGIPAKSYVIGVDISTGKAKDYSAIEVIDIGENKQVAEFMARVLPSELAMYIDMIGRYYNYALLVIERNNGGDIVIDDLRFNYMYQRLWRKKDINDKPSSTSSRRKRTRLKVGTYGFTTSGSSKPGLNKLLVDYIRDTDDGLKIFSNRLLNQLHTYVRKRDRSGKDTNKTEAEEGINNFDDLVMAMGLSLVGINDALDVNPGVLIPVSSNTDFKQMLGPKIPTNELIVERTQLLSSSFGSNVLMPISSGPSDVPSISASRILDDFTMQLGGIPIVNNVPMISPRKYYFDKEE